MLKSTYSLEKSADPKKDDSEVVAKLTELAEDLPTRGFDVYYNRIRTEGLVWNRKRVLRVYRGMKLGMRRRHKKRVPTRIQQPLETPGGLNEVWSMDFMSDSLSDGRRVRMFNVIDDYNREALAVEPGLSFPATRVTRVLNQLEEEIGLPKVIRVDNGPEFISKEFTAWCNGERGNRTLGDFVFYRCHEFLVLLSKPYKHRA